MSAKKITFNGHTMSKKTRKVIALALQKNAEELVEEIAITREIAAKRSELLSSRYMKAYSIEKAHVRSHLTAIERVEAEIISSLAGWRRDVVRLGMERAR